MNTAAPLQSAPTTSAWSGPIAAGLLQRKCSRGSATSSLGGICDERKKKRSGRRTKLALGEAGDSIEREADRVARAADQVTRGAACGACSKAVDKPFDDASDGVSDEANSHNTDKSMANWALSALERICR
jgi:hypothetical protein